MSYNTLTFRRLFIALIISQNAEAGFQVFLPILAFRRTQDPLLIGTLSFFAASGAFTFGLLAGLVVDRWNRKTLAVLGALLRVATFGTAMALLLPMTEGVWPVYLTAFTWAAASAVQGPACLAIMQAAVPPANLSRTFSLYSSAEHLMHVLTKPVFGFALSLSLSFCIYWICAAALLGALFLTLIPGQQQLQPGLSQRTHLVSHREALGWLLSRTHMRSLLLLEALLCAGIGAIMNLLVVYARQYLGVPESSYGALLACLPLGGVAGALLAPKLAQAWGEFRALAIASLGVPVIMAGLAWIPSLYTAIPLLFVGTGIFLVYACVLQPLLQKRTPPNIYGRVRIAFSTVATVCGPLGAVGAGALASATTVTHAWQLTSVLLLATTMLIATSLFHQPDDEAPVL